ncbi:peptidoglycan-binding domain-containing protein [Streptomyces lydicus]
MKNEGSLPSAFGAQLGRSVGINNAQSDTPTPPTCEGYAGVQVGVGTAWIPNHSVAGTSCRLDKEDRNPGVWALQHSLNQCYNSNIPEDGYFGSVTMSALMEVQTKIGARRDGEYGPLTRDRMLHAGTWADERFRYDGPGGY